MLLMALFLSSFSFPILFSSEADPFLPPLLVEVALSPPHFLSTARRYQMKNLKMKNLRPNPHNILRLYLHTHRRRLKTFLGDVASFLSIRISFSSCFGGSFLLFRLFPCSFCQLHISLFSHRK